MIIIYPNELVIADQGHPVLRVTFQSETRAHKAGIAFGDSPAFPEPVVDVCHRDANIMDIRIYRPLGAMKELEILTS